MRRNLRFILGSLTVLLVPLIAVAALYNPFLQLDGVNDYAAAPDVPSLDLGVGSNEDFTIEAFFYVPDLTSNANQALVMKGSNPTNFAYDLIVNFNPATPDFVFFEVWSALGGVQIGHSVDLDVGWHHVAAVFDNEFTATTDLRALYLDGAQVASSTSSEFDPGIRNSSSPLHIGANFGAIPFDGNIDEVRLSNIVRYSGLTYTVPTSNFSPDANTRALWHFDEAVGSTSFADSSGTGNTLTGLNGATTGSPGASTTPAAPTITGITPGDGQLSVAFTPDIDGSAPITNYKYSTDGGTTWLTRNPAATTSPLVITGLSNGLTYQVQLRAVNLNGDGTPTASTPGIPGIPSPTPAAPTITGITPGNGQLSVAFTPGSEGGAPITNYKYSTDGGTTWLTRNPAATTSPLVITGLMNGTMYQVQLRAVNTNGEGLATASTAAATRFTDDPLVRDNTVIKAIHFVELRTRINLLRVRFNLSPVSWSPDSLNGVIVHAIHLQQLRDALLETYDAALIPRPTLGPTLNPKETRIEATQIELLRSAVQQLEAQ